MLTILILDNSNNDYSHLAENLIAIRAIPEISEMIDNGMIRVVVRKSDYTDFDSVILNSIGIESPDVIVKHVSLLAALRACIPMNNPVLVLDSRDTLSLSEVKDYKNKIYIPDNFDFSDLESPNHISGMIFPLEMIRDYVLTCDEIGSMCGEFDTFIRFIYSRYLDIADINKLPKYKGVIAKGFYEIGKGNNKDIELLKAYFMKHPNKRIANKCDPLDGIIH